MIERNELKDVIMQSLKLWKVNDDVAESVSENLTLAHLYNHSTHGIQLMPRYKMWLENKILSHDDNLELECKVGNHSTYNAHKIFGQYALEMVIRQAIIDSDKSTTETFSIKNVGHFGYLKGILSKFNTNEHIILLLINTAGSKLVAPFNGSNKKMSTSCMAVIVPGGYCSDFTFPSTSENEVRYLLQQGNELNVPILINNTLSKNPNDLYDQNNNPLSSKAAILFDNHKLFNMAIFTEIMCGIISGSGTSQASNFNSGCFGMVLSTKNLPNSKLFESNIQSYIKYIDDERVHIPTINNDISVINLLEFESNILRSLKENLSAIG